jgi:hypothetical protein
MKRTFSIAVPVVALALLAAPAAQARGFGGGGRSFGGGGFRGGGFGGGGFRGFGGGGFGGDRFGGGLGGDRFGGGFGRFGGDRFGGDRFSGLGNLGGLGGDRFGGFNGGLGRGDLSGSSRNLHAALPSDGGFHGPVNVNTGNINRGNVAAGNHVTRSWSNSAMGYRGNDVRNSWANGYAHGYARGAGDWYGAGWAAGYPGAWYPDGGWGTGAAWLGLTSAAALGSWLGPAFGGADFASSPPVYYNYGTNVTYQDGGVYDGGQLVGTPEEYYQQAGQIAQRGAANPPQATQWKSIGVFGMVQGNESDATQIFQLAVDQNGIIRGNYTNTLTNTVLPVKGAANAKTKRAAWTVGSNKETVYEAGVYNLTQKEAPVLIHFGSDTTQQWLLVRLPPPPTKGGASGG